MMADDWVSIPQAVSTIAINDEAFKMAVTDALGFNTASGKYYCNSRIIKQRSY